MSEDRWRRIEDICHGALERRSEDRSEFVRAECSGDETLRREVELLIADGDVADSRLGMGSSGFEPAIGAPI